MSQKVIFYNVPSDRRGAFAARMAEAAINRRKRIIIRCADAEDARQLDAFLWTWRDVSFMPHEVLQPGAVPPEPGSNVYLVTEDTPDVDADVLLQLAPGEMAWAQRYATVLDVVDQESEDALAASRERYRAWKALGTVDLSFQAG